MFLFILSFDQNQAIPVSNKILPDKIIFLLYILLISFLEVSGKQRLIFILLNLFLLKGIRYSKNPTNDDNTSCRRLGRSIIALQKAIRIINNALFI